MKVRCRHCGELFIPGDESLELISEGFISADSANICDDCWDMLEHLPDDISEMYSDADPGM